MASDWVSLCLTSTPVACPLPASIDGSYKHHAMTVKSSVPDIPRQAVIPQKLCPSRSGPGGRQAVIWLVNTAKRWAVNDVIDRTFQTPALYPAIGVKVTIAWPSGKLSQNGEGHGFGLQSVAMYSDRVAEFNRESKWRGPQFQIADRGQAYKRRDITTSHIRQKYTFKKRLLVRRSNTS
ncbi:hypothetical protein CIRG_09917 [Coccidioides immitis RMSCC 2394]|uniref:Uncharacterized protein n=1 Tax=Coccidioides immitis RMSCC 2394 TaxID=404692 RepID=A0A0J6YNJ0_COCIT|nr:hypothetical protein CIRG_09917 [Coccidioides immitis RMSCC 2394]